MSETNFCSTKWGGAGAPTTQKDISFNRHLLKYAPKDKKKATTEEKGKKRDVEELLPHLEEAELDGKIDASVDGKGRAPCDGCIKNKGWYRWDQVKKELITHGQKYQLLGHPNDALRYQLYKQYNLVTHGGGNQRTKLPTCCEKGIKETFPSEVFKGFQEKKV